MKVRGFLRYKRPTMISNHVRQMAARMVSTIAVTLLVSPLHALTYHPPKVRKAIPVIKAVPHSTKVNPCPDKECVETFWQDNYGTGSDNWSEPLRPVRVDKQFAVPVYLASWPVRPFTIMGFVYVLYRPNTSNPQTSAVRALADLAKRHGADAVSLRPRRISGRWYTAGTAIRWGGEGQRQFEKWNRTAENLRTKARAEATKE